jgi:hypothetical protein
MPMPPVVFGLVLRVYSPGLFRPEMSVVAEAVG